MLPTRTSQDAPGPLLAPSDSAGKKPSKGQPDEMVEIRFVVPGQSSRMRGSDAGSNKSDVEDDDVDDVSAAQAFHEAIKEKAKLGHVPGDIILSFEEVLVLTPRGRYDVDMFPDFLRLRGKTYDYKMVYSSISRLSLLPKDELHILFIVCSFPAFRLSSRCGLQAARRCFHLPIPSVSHRILSPISSFLLNLPLPCYVGKKTINNFRSGNLFQFKVDAARHVLRLLLTTGQVTEKRKSASSHAVKILYLFSNGGIRLYIDGCQSTSTGARLGRETM